MAKEATNWTLYVLKLQGDKWYVDVTTDDPKTELKKHQNGAGTTWTQKYKAIDISNSKELGEISEDDAEKYTRKFIKKRSFPPLTLIKQCSILKVREYYSCFLI